MEEKEGKRVESVCKGVIRMSYCVIKLDKKKKNTEEG